MPLWFLGSKCTMVVCRLISVPLWFLGNKGAIVVSRLISVPLWFLGNKGAIVVCRLISVPLWFLGNKGAVAISFMFDGTSFCFVCCHLTSGHEKMARFVLVLLTCFRVNF